MNFYDYSYIQYGTILHIKSAIKMQCYYFCKIKVIKLVFLTKNHKYNYNLGNIDFAMPKYLKIAKNMRYCKLKGANQPIGRLQKNRLF